MTVFNHASILLNALLLHRRKNATAHSPMVFLAKDLGGLILSEVSGVTSHNVSLLSMSRLSSLRGKSLIKRT